MKEKHVGTCALCGRKCNLTFEHIPPRAAYNSKPVKTVVGDALINMIGDSERAPWDFEGIEYTQNQKGSGRFSLCEECNNKTGSWYGAEYAKFAHTAAEIVLKKFPDGINAVELYDIYPSRIIKQVLSLFCSIGGHNSKTQDIRDFVLDRNAVGLPKDKYKLHMYFTASQVSRQIDKFAICSRGIRGTEIKLVSEITSAPLGFILYYDPKPEYHYDGLDITSFSDISYDQKCNVTFPLAIYEVNNLLPLDYRTKAEIESAMHIDTQV